MRKRIPLAVQQPWSEILWQHKWLIAVVIMLLSIATYVSF